MKDCAKVCGLCTGGCCLCLFVLSLVVASVALPLAMIIMGSMYITDCPAEHYIPIYLVVTGAFALLKPVIMGGAYAKNKDDIKKGVHAISMINLFLFAWFIAGCYWIYHIHTDYQSTDPAKPKYCYKQLYLFAFWIQIIFCVCMLLEVIGSIFHVCCERKASAPL